MDDLPKNLKDTKHHTWMSEFKQNMMLAENIVNNVKKNTLYGYKTNWTLLIQCIDGKKKRLTKEGYKRTGKKHLEASICSNYCQSGFFFCIWLIVNLVLASTKMILELDRKKLLEISHNNLFEEWFTHIISNKAGIWICRRLATHNTINIVAYGMTIEGAWKYMISNHTVHC